MAATKKPKQSENIGAAAPLPPRELLRSWSLWLVAMLCVALITAGLVASYVAVQRANHGVVASAPALLWIASELAEATDVKDEEGLRRLGAAMERIPNVRSCSLEVRAATESGATEPDAAHVLRYATKSVPRSDALRLQSPLKDRTGQVVGRMTLEFAATHREYMDPTLWTGLAAVGAVVLGAFWFAYRRVRRLLRPLEQVQENLWAYHNGVEPALELLSVRDSASSIANAWNSFVEGVTEVRMELARHHCRDAITTVQKSGSRAPSRVLEHLPIGIVRIDDRDLLTYCNGAAAALLGIGGDADAGAPRLLRERLGDAELAEKLLSLRERAAGASGELRMTLPESETVVRVTALAGETSPDELTLMLQDVSQFVEAERSRDEFLAHITHELRTPLTNIRAYTETLTQDFLDDENARRECYNVIMSETRRLTKLIEDVLSVSQIEAGGARLARTHVRVEELLRQTVQEMQAHADAKKIDLTLKVSSKTPAVSGDRHRLHQVWTNLIGNAIKYTPEGGKVLIEIESLEQRLIVRVVDTGIGIARENHEKVFEKFFRVNAPEVESTEGTGLGLSITREILRLHGGTIQVESEPGKGSAFIVELPALKSGEPVAAKR